MKAIYRDFLNKFFIEFPVNLQIPPSTGLLWGGVDFSV